MSADDLLKLLTTGPAGIAVLALITAGYLYRARESDRAEHVATIKADGEAQRALLTQTIPLAQKMIEGIDLLARSVETLDRTAERMEHKGGDRQ
jgi:hypothetical protein